MAHRGAGEIRADVTVTGDAVGQLAHGRNTVPDAGRPGAGQHGHRPPGRRSRRRPAPGPAASRPARGRSSTATTRSSRCSPSWRRTAPSRCRRRPAWAPRRFCGTSPTTPRSPPSTAGWCASRPADQSRDDLLQALFTTFCTTDVPMRPTLEQLRAAPATGARRGAPRRRRAVRRRRRRAAVPAPELRFRARRARNVGGVMRSVTLAGLTVDAAGELLAHVVGEPVDRSVVYALWGLTRGAPAGAHPARRSARARTRTAEFVPTALRRGAAAVHRRLPAGPAAAGAARRGARRRAVRAAARGRVRRARRRRDGCAGGSSCGLVTASDTGTYRFAGGELDPIGGAAAATPRRAGGGVRDVGPPPPRTPSSSRVGSAEPFRVLQEVARRQQSWRAVLAIGAVLDVAYAARGPLGRLALLPAGHAGGRARPRRPGRGGHGPAPARHRRARPRRPGGGLRPALGRARHPRGAGPHRGGRGHPAEPGDDHRPPPPAAGSRSRSRGSPRR